MIVLANNDAHNDEAKVGESMDVEKASLPPSGRYEETKVAAVVAVSEAEGSSESEESGLSLVSCC